MKRATLVQVAVDFLAIRIDSRCLQRLPLSAFVMRDESLHKGFTIITLTLHCLLRLLLLLIDVPVVALAHPSALDSLRFDLSLSKLVLARSALGDTLSLLWHDVASSTLLVDLLVG